MAQWVKNLPAVQETVGSTGAWVSIPESGRSPGKGNGNPLQDSCLENPIDRGTLWATVHGLKNAEESVRGIEDRVRRSNK